MSYSALPLPSFAGGLNLRDKEDNVDATQAIDALNVTFTQHGGVKQRPGFAALGSAHTNALGTIMPYYKTDGTGPFLVAGAGTRIEVLDTTGAIVSSGAQTGATSGTWGFARFGSPNNEYIYAGQGSDTIYRWSGSAWSQPAGMPKAGSLAIQTPDNRLVAARFNGTTGGPTGGAGTSSPSHVYFSDAGAPETWTSTNYVQLTPSDGEKVQAVVAWREFVFVFKETKFFVFFGNSVDSDGNVVFNYRVVNSGQGAVGPNAVCAGTDGVYFVSRRGVYVTTGQEPVRISDLVDPIFDSTQSASSFYLGGTMAQSSASNTALTWHNDRLYLGYTSTGGANNYTLCWDPVFKWWTLYDFPAAALCSWRISSSPELMFADTTNKKLYRHNTSYTSDDGTAITSRWRSGWFDYGWITRYGRMYNSPAEKTIRGFKVWGSGIVSVSIAHDWGIGAGDTDLVNLTPAGATGSLFGGANNFGGTGNFGDSAPALKGYTVRRAVRGSTFSLSFQNSTLNQAWSVDRLALHLRSVRRDSPVEAEAPA